MRQQVFAKNSPIDEKRISLIETVVSRLTRRSKKVAQAIIPPIPISNCVIGDEVKGEVLKYMFCCPGVINKGGIFLNKKSESGAEVILKIDNDLGGSTRAYRITRRNLLFEPMIEVDTWDRMTVLFHIVDSTRDKITEVWVGLIWTPTIKDAAVKDFLIDKLDEGASDLLQE